ncbi:MAG: heme o synthase [Rickettsiales bacterium]
MVIYSKALNSELGMKESRVRDYVSLLKPGVMSLVVYTAVIGLWIAPGHIHPVMAFIAILCVAMGSGAAGAINMWYDRDIDAIMTRTKKRPIPSKAIQPDAVLHLGIAVSFASVICMGLFVNILSAVILAFAIFFYIVIYTIFLKRRTPQNIVIGGAAGAFPPVIGWTAVTDSISIEPIIMFLIIFLWTPPHFWALALAKSDDYKKAKIPMMPNAKGHSYTKKQIVIYAVLLWIASVAPYFLDMASSVYLIGAVILSSIFAYLCIKTVFVREKAFYMKTFGFSIFYLFALFGLLVI